MPPGFTRHGGQGGPFGGGGPFGHGPMTPGSPTAARTDLFWVHDLFVLAFLLIVVVAIVLVVRWLARRPRYAAAMPVMASPAVGELDMRYARGEVDREEFLRRRADLLTPGYAYAAPAPAPAAAAAPAAEKAADDKPAKA